ncbi:MAG: ABC transporter permease [Bacteroidales bacterium]|jgi:ABC-type lipoprotein release transport system permease subunit|nr:ABC transporter permease [Bacteroidales bacterium]
MSEFRLAWRNIWRNKRRTLLTAASIFLAIFLALIVRSLQTGWFDNLVAISIQSYTGHIQIHKKGYWDDRDINNSILYDDSLTSHVTATKNVDKTVPRLEYFALSSYGKQTKAVMLSGTDPGKEDALTHLSRKVIKGRYLDTHGNGILVSQGLASFLGLTTGDTLVLLGQGYHGVSAAGKFPVCGIIHMPSPQLDNQMVYMNLLTAQEFFSTGNRITSLSLTLLNPDEINSTVAVLKSEIGMEKFEIMRWDEMMEEVMQALKAKTGGGMIIIAILYMIVGFGIFGTVIMMTNERLKEFGVMVSVGMQKTRLAIILTLEMIFIGLTGTIAGVVTAVPIMVYFHVYPIHLWGGMAQAFISFGIEPLMPLAVKPGFILWNVISVLVIVLLTCIYPIRKALKLKVVESLHK